jgi:aminoglycoside phosphotransferase (APT) family kinase protein
VPTWSAEIVVDPELACRLLSRFEQLEIESLRPLGEGWDRTVWLVNERWVFGFPRREMVVPGIEREIEYLPRLASLLPLPIPQPAFVGRPSEDFPWPFFGSAWIPGHEAAETDLDDAARETIGLEVATFLKRLHSRDVFDAIGANALPVDPMGRANMQKRVPITREDFAELARLGLWSAPKPVMQLLDQAELLPESREPPVVVHGDFHFRHVLVDNGRASGVIDWIDLSQADPSVDLSFAWSFLPAEARPRFFEAYGPVSDEQRLRAQVLALNLSAVLARYAQAEGHPQLAREALAALARARDAYGNDATCSAPT